MAIITGKNNTGLVVHVKKMLSKTTRYMWGTFCQPITAAYVDAKAKQYPSQYSTARVSLLKSLAGKAYCSDCVGLIKGYLWEYPESGKYNGAFDVNANIMYSSAAEKGAIGTLPERPGVLVYCKTHPHIGVYIGNGWVIESTLGARGDGIVKTKLSAFAWEYWCQCPYIEADNKTVATTAETTTSTAAFAVGDRVKIIGLYASSAYAKKAANGAAVGKYRYITKIYPKAAFPYQLGTVKGDKSTAKTTGFAAAGAIVKA